MMTARKSGAADAIVVGAGVIGSAVALRLAQRGARRIRRSAIRAIEPTKQTRDHVRSTVGSDRPGGEPCDRLEIVSSRHEWWLFVTRSASLSEPDGGE
jgi:glycine/D-amino acid oxidase-like deaminating enzyme